MFEEICLTCGKHLSDDGRVYCSDECQNIDTASPSISSASSALSSPRFGYAIGGEVPALVSSALGKALRGYHTRDHHSISSSASSTSCSVLTDEEDEDSHFVSGSEGAYQDEYAEGKSKSSGLYPVLRAPLSYARRPSGTNNVHAAPHVLGRVPTSASTSGHVYSAPRSAPIHSHSQLSTDDETYSDFGSPSRDELESFTSLTTPDEDQNRSTITKAKRTRNRASLPAYFSLLQVSSDAQPRVSLSVSNSSGHSVTRPSPPTPKLTIAGMPIHPFTAPPAAVMQATPRGRRRDLEASRSTRVSSNDSSSSRSRAENPFAPPATASEAFRSQLSSKGSKSSMEKILDWTAVSGLSRGRATIRRNSSPPPKMVLTADTEQFNIVSRGRKADSTSRLRSRGRVMVSELDGVIVNKEAPGFGHGRSGLLHREQAISQRFMSGKPSF
ncbi:hypothetical protein F5879DRAFT_72819 [Lentinula edodes]|nr:hypothetical protein F5051DRAFT_123882 [Lentinula edodes]KAJ3904431.1 hypothetical protein F5879DRAFT_72819 [Lentinula edodes]KAJ3918099.1 hypothetical protein F5877DRAFT_67675 [Lentinula edodes]